jgi:uncharacterized membrane-anchored protein
MARFKLRFHLLVLFQIVLLTGMLGFKEFTAITGQQITLQTVPVDPWDMFRGEYVALSYDFSRLEGYALTDWRHPDASLGRLQKGDAVYVTLRRNGRFWIYESISRNPPESGTIFLRGTVRSYTPARPSTKLSGAPTDASVNIDYGIESYFVQHGTAIDLERQRWTRGTVLAVDVRVDRFGRAVIRNVRAERTGSAVP